MLAGLRQSPPANIELEGLVNQPRLGKQRVSLFAPDDELVLFHTIPDVPVGPALLGHGGEGARLGASIRSTGWVIMADIDAVVIGEGVKFGGDGME